MVVGVAAGMAVMEGKGVGLDVFVEAMVSPQCCRTGLEGRRPFTQQTLVVTLD